MYLFVYEGEGVCEGEEDDEAEPKRFRATSFGAVLIWSLCVDKIPADVAVETSDNILI